jgi:hypothetical protein
MPMTFYDRSGKPVAYTEDDVHVFLYSGYPVGYLYDSSVYSYSGRHLGTLRAGWIRDHAGDRVFFTDAVSSGPPLPSKLVKPPKLLKKPKPAKGRREAPPPRAEDTEEWSAHPVEKFFIS